ncbi:chromatin assembly factor 1 subunit A-domain-containing protein [Blastocladiella britannica]|nr:chromatin assembly factor 1 subunit A-domain-containing protein [Blastocladiella britannica]
MPPHGRRLFRARSERMDPCFVDVEAYSTPLGETKTRLVVTDAVHWYIANDVTEEPIMAALLTDPGVSLTADIMEVDGALVPPAKKMNRIHWKIEFELVMTPGSHLTGYSLSCPARRMSLDEIAPSLASLLTYCATATAPAPPLLSPPLPPTTLPPVCDAPTSAPPLPQPSKSAPATPAARALTAAEKRAAKEQRERDRAEKDAAKVAREAEREEARIAKETDRVAKEAERAAKEAERERKVREKEEARLEREREKQKRANVGNASIMDMFVRRTAKPVVPAAPLAESGSDLYFDQLFSPFFVKANAVLVPPRLFAAPVHSTFATPTDTTALDCLRSVRRNPAPPPLFPSQLLAPTSTRRLVSSNNEDADMGGALRFKLLQFREDHRPAYWGTWAKPATGVTARRPFARATGDVIDYEYDSEAEWESENDEDAEEIDSENEGAKGDEDEEEDAWETDDDDDDEGWLVKDASAGSGMALAASMATDAAGGGGGPAKRVARSLQAQIVGPFFPSESVDPWTCPHPQLEGMAIVFFRGASFFHFLLLVFCWFRVNGHVGLDISAPFDPRPMAKDGTMLLDATTAAPSTASRRSTITAFPEQHLLKFIRTVHGSPLSVTKLVDELKAKTEFAATSKAQLDVKLKQIAVKEKRLASRPCYYVREAILSELGLSPATLMPEENGGGNGGREELDDDDDEPLSSPPRPPSTPSPEEPSMMTLGQFFGRKGAIQAASPASKRTIRATSIDDDEQQESPAAKRARTVDQEE